jgi:hypothetical protein
LEATGGGSQVSVFAKTDIPAGSYVAVDDSVYSILFTPQTTTLIKDMARLGVNNLWKAFDRLMLQYGTVTNFFGEASILVDADNIFAFINHAFNDTNIQRVPLSVTDAKAVVSELLKSKESQKVYSPVIDRSFMQHLEGSHVTDHDLKAGERIFCP